MVTCLVADMPSSGSERYARGRLSPNPLSMGMHSSLARDELMPPNREELGLLSGSHFDAPSLGGLRGGALGSLSGGDREPSLLDQVMAERQRGGWRLDDDPLVMSRRQDEISHQEEIYRRHEISRQREMSRQHEEKETMDSGGRRVFLRNVRLCVCVCMHVCVCMCVSCECAHAQCDNLKHFLQFVVCCGATEAAHDRPCFKSYSVTVV